MVLVVVIKWSWEWKKVKDRIRESVLDILSTYCMPDEIEYDESQEQDYNTITIKCKDETDVIECIARNEEELRKCLER